MGGGVTLWGGGRGGGATRLAASTLLDAALPQVLCKSWTAQVVLQTVSLEAGGRRGGGGAGRR